MTAAFLAPTAVGAVAQEAAGGGGDGQLSFVVIGIWILLLAIFVGFELITKVPPTIHTPLMSGANAISGITIVGALYCAGTGYDTAGQVLGFFAIALATINRVGGFLVTDRMLQMFKKKKEKKSTKGGDA